MHYQKHFSSRGMGWCATCLPKLLEFERPCPSPVLALHGLTFMQDLQDPEKLAHAREVAERGLGDLQIYLPENSVCEDGTIDLRLRGACK